MIPAVNFRRFYGRVTKDVAISLRVLHPRYALLTGLFGFVVNLGSWIILSSGGGLFIGIFNGWLD